MDDLGARGVDVTTAVDARPPWSRGSPIRIRRAEVTKNDAEEVKLEKAREAERTRDIDERIPARSETTRNEE